MIVLGVIIWKIYDLWLLIFISASELLKVLKNTQTVGCYSVIFIYGILWAQSFFKKKTTPSPYISYHNFGLEPEFSLSKCKIQIDIFSFYMHIRWYNTVFASYISSHDLPNYYWLDKDLPKPY